MPTRTWPPSITPLATIGNCVRPTPKIDAPSPIHSNPASAVSRGHAQAGIHLPGRDGAGYRDCNDCLGICLLCSGQLAPGLGRTGTINSH